jgi:hypothetical protein
MNIVSSYWRFVFALPSDWKVSNGSCVLVALLAFQGHVFGGLFGPNGPPFFRTSAFQDARAIAQIEFYLLLTVLFFSPQLHQYEIVGRKVPTEKDPKPSLLKMTIFAPNTVVAKSRFWYFVSMLQKLKKANGEIVDLKEARSCRVRCALKKRQTKKRPLMFSLASASLTQSSVLFLLTC